MSKGEKMSELEFQIRILEQKEALLSDKELVRLSNLREQAELQKKLGWEVKRHLPVKLLSKFKPPQSKRVVSNQIKLLPKSGSLDHQEVMRDPNSFVTDTSPPSAEPDISLPGQVCDGNNEINLMFESNAETDIKKKKAANGSNNYLKELKRLNSKDNKKGVLNMKAVRYSWNNLSVEEKEKFKEMGQVGKESNASISKEKKKARDKVYQANKAFKKKKEKDENNKCLKEFEVLIEEKRLRLKSLLEKKENLMKQIEAAGNENTVITKLSLDLAKDETNLKSRVKEALVHHKICKG